MTDLKKLDKTIEEIETNSKEMISLNKYYNELIQKISKSHEDFQKWIFSLQKLSEEYKKNNDNLKKDITANNEKILATIKEQKDVLQNIITTNNNFFSSLSNTLSADHKNTIANINQIFSSVEQSFENLLNWIKIQHKKTTETLEKNTNLLWDIQKKSGANKTMIIFILIMISLIFITFFGMLIQNLIIEGSM